MLHANHASRQGHGRERHRDGLGILRKLHLRHDRPGGTTARTHEGELVRHLVEKVLRLLDRAEVGTERDLLDAREAQQLESLTQFAHISLATKLAHEGGGDGSDDLIAMLDGPDDLSDLALVSDGTKGTVHKTLTAAHALLIIDVGATVLIRADGMHAAGGGARTYMVVDGRVRADLSALSAFDAEVLVDMGLLVHERDGLLWAYLATRMGKTALAGIRDLVDVVLTGVAGKLDDVDEWRLVVRDVVDLRLIKAVGDAPRLLHSLQRESHGKADALPDDGALQKDALSIGGDITWQDLKRQLVKGIVYLLTIHLGLVTHSIANLRNLSKYLTSNFSQICVDSSHSTRHGHSSPIDLRHMAPL